MRIKRLLVNNGFPNCIIDKISRKFTTQIRQSSAINDPVNSRTTQGEDGSNTVINSSSSINIGAASAAIQTSVDSSVEGVPPIDQRPIVNVFYNNQYHKGYKRDEEALMKIIKRHVCQIEAKIKIFIYYKSKKICNIFMKNNLSKTNLPDRHRSHIVYEFICSEGECSSFKNSYIGMTNLKLSEKLNSHRYNGSILKHYRLAHLKDPSLEELINSTKILYYCDNRRNLPVHEALFIRNYKPNLNENTRDFTCLKLNIS